MTEAQIESRMAKMIERRGGLCYKFVSPGTAGVPDRIVIAEGKTIYVELKKPFGRMAQIQSWQVGRMREAGADVRVLYGWEQVRAFVDEILPKEGTT